MTVILVVGRDQRFRTLVRAQLREEGYEARGLETLEEAEQEMAASAPRPAAVVFDAADVSPAGLQTRLESLAGRAPVMAVAGSGQRLEARRVRVLRRPVRVQDVVREVKNRVAARG